MVSMPKLSEAKRDDSRNSEEQSHDGSVSGMIKITDKREVNEMQNRDMRGFVDQERFFKSLRGSNVLKQYLAVTMTTSASKRMHAIRRGVIPDEGGKDPDNNNSGFEAMKSLSNGKWQDWGNG